MHLPFPVPTSSSSYMVMENSYKEAYPWLSPPTGIPAAV